MCNEQHLTTCVDLNMIVVVGFLGFFGGVQGFFFLASPLDNPMLVLLRWEYVGIHLDSLFALFFFAIHGLGVKTNLHRNE